MKAAETKKTIKPRKKVDKTNSLRQARYRSRTVTITLKDDVADRFRSMAEEHGLSGRDLIRKLLADHGTTSVESTDSSYTRLLEMLNSKPKQVALHLLSRYESEQARISYRNQLKSLCPEWGERGESSEIGGKVTTHFRSVCRQIELITAHRQPALNLALF